MTGDLVSEWVSVFLGSFGDVLALTIVCWIVVMGGVGAALGSKTGHALGGFLVGVFCPIPVVGWLLVIVFWGTGHRPMRRRSEVDDLPTYSM